MARKTVTIPAELHKRLAATAVERGTSIQAIVESAIEDDLGILPVVMTEVVTPEPVMLGKNHAVEPQAEPTTFVNPGVDALRQAFEAEKGRK